uniref:Uncharacterized protein n=1 Tax=Tetraselmis chuii TaxID=63592 RepID=A0A6U1FSB0_9CHLO|mmetsp:Transcript_20126/g.35884  ORF Transcript_20126/g.35884 Transcript_20126/m.35884 type:complete len:228 (+) Transcript_20126:260-943(+)|eukprot:CAMPEP_0177776990 /NCGR_PEP_ID=MMETSP0491_2-20121128/15031_1 /TAXON_ID=63592 /ORGANISM="Tetraselmis chuii, Strain PLY429" /LENGTH=227 /DNA_ID=CAMNT_0019295865 /DNA_START=248 /DNA_END=931 /DNA_ORIENTATION=+
MGNCSSGATGNSGGAVNQAAGHRANQSSRPFAPAVPRVKLVLLGDTGVGKSCIVQRYVRGAFDPSSKVTVGAAFMAHSVPLPDGSTVKFEIWDTAGQERYMSLAPLYYRGASAAAIVYDITVKESFDKAKYWTKELQKNAGGEIVIILVGNKTDLEAHREVGTEEAQAFAESEGMLFLEGSAKTADKIPELFEGLAARLSNSRTAHPPTTAPAPAALPTSTMTPAPP